MLLEKKNKPWKCVQSRKCLRAFSLQEVWSEVWRCKLSCWCYRLCSVLHCWCWTFFQAIEELKNFCQGLDRRLSGLDGSTGFPPGSSAARQKARVSSWGSGGAWGPWAAWAVGRAERASRRQEHRGSHLPLFCPSGGRGGGPYLNCLKSAKCENVRASDSSRCFCISYSAFHKVIGLRYKPV